MWKAYEPSEPENQNHGLSALEVPPLKTTHSHPHNNIYTNGWRMNQSTLYALPQRNKAHLRSNYTSIPCRTFGVDTKDPKKDQWFSPIMSNTTELDESFDFDESTVNDDITLLKAAYRNELVTPCVWLQNRLLPIFSTTNSPSSSKWNDKSKPMYRKVVPTHGKGTKTGRRTAYSGWGIVSNDALRSPSIQIASV